MNGIAKVKQARRAVILLFSIMFLFAVSLSVNAAKDVVQNSAEGTKRLKQFHGKVKSFKAKFKQVLKNEHQLVLQSASGTLYLKRPGKFRWDYVKPDLQQIVSDGKKIWIYDQELEQVTIKSLAKGLGKTPARVLTGSGSLDKEFEIKDLGKKQGLFWVELKPKGSDNEFDSVRIAFGKSLKKMVLVDNLKQTTTIEFFMPSINPNIKASKFNFKIPKGVDVVKGQH